MEIRVLQRQELLPALHLVWEVFAEDVASSYTPEGVAEFQKFIKYDNMLPMFQRQEVIFFGAFDGGELCGTMAVKQIGHICLFFVKKSYQGKGVGRMLFTSVYNYCANQLRINKITVNAAPGAVPKYLHMGMRQIDVEQNVNGMCYVPMEMFVNPAFVQPTQEKKKHMGLIIGAIVAAVLLIVLLVFAGAKFIKSVYSETVDSMHDNIEQWDDDDPMNPDSPLWDERGTYGDDSEDSSDIASGIAAIPEYIAEDLPYEINDDSYTYEDDEKKSTIISFSVGYPKIEGLDEKVQETINEKIKSCALATVDEIYNHPSEEFKEKILGIENPMLTSYGTYKVCYANEDFISIVFEDTGTKGSQDDYYMHFRTLNISVKDGKVYEVKDIVNLNDEFIDEWLETMREEADNDAFLSELNAKDMKKTLAGESKDGNYIVNFFVDKDGIEIGYDLNYAANDSHDLGYAWVTAPFTFEEIAPYEKDKTFWEYFREK